MKIPINISIDSVTIKADPQLNKPIAVVSFNDSTSVIIMVEYYTKCSYIKKKKQFVREIGRMKNITTFLSQDDTVNVEEINQDGNKQKPIHFEKKEISNLKDILPDLRKWCEFYGLDTDQIFACISYMIKPHVV